MRERTVAFAATVALCAATAVQFARVFTGTTWLLGLAAVIGVVACIVAVVSSEATRTVLLAVGGVVATTLAVHPSERLLVLPTPAAVVDTVHDLVTAPRTLATVSVPTPATGTAWLLAVFSVWIATAIALRAVRGGAPRPLVIGPCAAVAVAAAMAGRHGAVVVTTIWLAAASAVVVAIDRCDAATAPRAQTSRRRRATPVTALAVVGAIVVAALLAPAFSNRTGLIDYRKIGRSAAPRSIVAVSPMSSLRARLVDPTNPELFRVRADQPARWRLVALDRYRDGAWVLDNPTVSDELRSIRFPDGVPVTTVRQEYEIGPMRGSFLPAADRPQRVSRTDGHRTFSDMVVVTDSGTLVVPDEDHETTKYTVVSQFVAPSDADLHAARLTSAERASLSRSLDLPPIDPDAATLARRIVAGASDPYAQALALQRWFRDPDRFRYDTSVDLRETTDALSEFLFVERRGFCQQFASAFAVLARAIGLPTRVAVGFLPGRIVDDVHVVRTRDAHAWPEVWFGGLGWIAFEPTPTRPAATTAGNGPGPGPTTTTSVASTSTTATTPVPTTVPTASTTAAATGLDAASGRGTSTGTVVGVAVAVLAVLLVVAGTTWMRRVRRQRRRRSGTPAERIDRAWTTAVGRLAFVGVRPDPSHTPIEFASKIAAARGAGSAAPPCRALALAHAAAAYGATPPDDDTANRAWDLVEELEAALRADARGQSRRIRFRLWW